MAKRTLKSENGITLSVLEHETGAVRVYFVEDRRRVPGDWTFNDSAKALAKYEERLENAKQQPPTLPR